MQRLTLCFAGAVVGEIVLTAPYNPLLGTIILKTEKKTGIRQLTKLDRFEWRAVAPAC
jgi:hypothetical protein